MKTYRVITEHGSHYILQRHLVAYDMSEALRIVWNLMEPDVTGLTVKAISDYVPGPFQLSSF